MAIPNPHNGRVNGLTVLSDFGSLPKDLTSDDEAERKSRFSVNRRNFVDMSCTTCTAESTLR